MTVNTDLIKSLNEIFYSSFFLFNALNLTTVNFNDFNVGVLGDDCTEELSIVHLFEDIFVLLVFSFSFRKIRLLKPISDDFLFG